MSTHIGITLLSVEQGLLLWLEDQRFGANNILFRGITILERQQQQQGIPQTPHVHNISVL